MKGKRAALEVLFVLLLAAASVLVVRDHQRDDAPTLDETYHLLAGAEYVLDGTFTANLEHPPLMKDLAGFGLAGSGALPPSRYSPVSPSPTGRFLPFVYGNRLPPDRMVALGRRPFPFLLALLVVVTWAGARAAFGVAPGLLAAALVALEPTLVAHAGVIHTDAGAALTMTASVALVFRAARRDRPGGWILAGAVLGAALATKFTAVLLLPCLALAPLLRKEPDPAAGPPPFTARFLRAALGPLLAAGAALVVLWSVYAWNLRNMTAEDSGTAVERFLAVRGVPFRARESLLDLAALSPPLGHYAAGLASVSTLSVRGRGANYFHGRVSDGPFLAYFPAAFALKSTPSFLAAALALLLLGGRRLLSRPFLAYLVPGAILLAAAMTSSFNIGIRHLLPVYPLLAIAGAGVLAERLPSRAFAAAALVLGLGSAASLWASHPFEMSYFNFLAGGPEGGSRWLTDSNIDWGQDMKRLAAVLRRNGWEEETTVVAYSGLATNYYMRRVRVLDPSRPIEPGRYAVGATIEAIGGRFVSEIDGPAAGAQVEELVRLLHARGRRVARVGSITVWDLPPAGGPPPGPAPRTPPPPRR